MNHLNIVELVGRLGKEPEAKYFPSGKCLAKVSLAVNRPGKDLAPNWFDLEFWGQQAETITNYGSKGSLISVQGELKLDTWTDKETGTQRRKPVINVSRFEFMSSSQSKSEPKVAAGAGW